MATTLGFPNEVVAMAVRISLSPTAPNEQGLATVDTFLTTAVLRIMNNAALPIHAVNRAFEQTFRLPFRAFRQPSLQAFLECHPEFELFDVYACPANLKGALPPQTRSGPHYFALCDHIEEQEVALWRLREELSSLETSLVGHSSNSQLLSGFLTESNDVQDFAHVLTFKVTAVTPNGVELPILIEPRNPSNTTDDDIGTARKSLTRIVERELAILRKTDETVGFEMSDHKHQIASLQHRVTAEIDRLCSMYDEAHDMAPIAPVAAPVPVYSDQYGYPMPRVPQSSWGPSKSDDRRSSAVRGSAVRTQQPSSTRNDASDPDGTFSSRNDGPPAASAYPLQQYPYGVRDPYAYGAGPPQYRYY